MFQLSIIVFFTLVGVYLVAGLLFSIAFLVKGLQKIDEVAHAGSLGFRIIIFPGCVVFWPVLMRLWMNAAKEGGK